jgi:hypothetical protein
MTEQKSIVAIMAHRDIQPPPVNGLYFMVVVFIALGRDALSWHLDKKCTG